MIFLLIPTVPSFVLYPTLFDGLDTNPKDHEIIPTWGHVKRCVYFHPFEFLWFRRPSRFGIKRTWTSDISTNHMIHVPQPLLKNGLKLRSIS